jgi:hypothetical protein
LIDALQKQLVPSLSNTHYVKEGEWISVYGNDPDDDNYIDEICDTLDRMGSANFKMYAELKKVNPKSPKPPQGNHKSVCAEISAGNEDDASAELSDCELDSNCDLGDRDLGDRDVGVDISSMMTQSAVPLSSAMNELFIHVQDKFHSDELVAHWNGNEPWAISFGEAVSNILLKDHDQSDPVSLLVFDAGFMLNVAEIMTHFCVNVNVDSEKPARPHLNVQCFESKIELASDLISKVPMMNVHVGFQQEDIDTVQRIPGCTINAESNSFSLSFTIANCLGIHRHITL